MLNYEKRRLSRIVCSILTLSGTACASSVDLSPGPQIGASNDPDVLGVINEEVGQLAVDDQRVYWIGQRANTSALRSCEKANCVNTLISYATDAVMPLAGFAVRRGQVYWFSVDSGDGTWSLRTCASSGCGIGARSIVTSARTYGSLISAFSNDTVYMTSTTDAEVVSLPLDGSAAEPRHLHVMDRPAISMAVAGDYLYELTLPTATQSVSDGPITVLSGGVLRVKIDGSEPVQILASDSRVAQVPRILAAQHTLAVDSSGIYWVAGALYGTIAHCPITGCLGNEQPLVEPVRSPYSLLLDGGNIYWQNETASQGFALSGCALSGCIASAPLASELDALTEVAADDDYLYAATAAGTTDSTFLATSPYANIRRIAKLTGQAQ